MTPMGKMMREERKERGLLLGDMADALGMSSPYLSQLETGAKPINEAFVEKVIRYFELNATDAQAMRRAAAKSLAETADSVTIDLRPSSAARDRELASNFALSFNRLKPETKKRLRELLKDSAHG